MKIPIFIGHGQDDTIARHQYGLKTKDILVEAGQQVTWKSYEGLDHSADPRELRDLEEWLEERLKA